jgi:hypothetical protein
LGTGGEALAADGVDTASAVTPRPTMIRPSVTSNSVAGNCLPGRERSRVARARGIAAPLLILKINIGEDPAVGARDLEALSSGLMSWHGLSNALIAVAASKRRARPSEHGHRCARRQDRPLPGSAFPYYFDPAQRSPCSSPRRANLLIPRRCRPGANLGDMLLEVLAGSEAQ